MIKIWDIWSGIDIYEFLETCDLFDEIIIYAAQEYEILSDFDYSIFNRYKFLQFHIGNTDTKRFPLIDENIQVKFYPLFWATRSIVNAMYGYVLPTKKSRLFACMNGKCVFERALLLDKLLYHNLKEDLFYTWRYNRVEGNHIGYEFKSFTPKKHLLKEKGWNQFKPPKKILKAYVGIVSETSHREIYLTEKTFTYILYKMPVIVFGAPNSNLFLKSLGFKLLDNFINYDFDQIEDTVERATRLTLELKKIKQIKTMDLDFFITQIQHIGEYNFTQLLKIIENDSINYDKEFVQHYLDFSEIKQALNFFSKLRSI